MWLVVDLSMDTKRSCFKEDIGLCAENMLTILGSIVNIMGWEGGRGQSYVID